MTDTRADLEQLVLACMFDVEGYHYAVGLLDASSMTITEHRDVFRALQALQESSQTVRGKVDPVRVFDWLRDNKTGVQLETIIAIGQQTWIASSAEYHVQRLWNAHTADRVRQMGFQLSQLPSCDVETLDSIVEQIEAIRSARPVEAFLSMEQILKKRAELLKSGIVKLKTGVKELDSTFGGGVRPGQLTIVAARPGDGKSVMLGQIATNFAKAGRPVSLVSLEMADVEFSDRMLATIPEAELTHLPIYVADTVFDRAAITAACRLSVKRHKSQLILLDYIQLVEGRGDTREQQVSAVSRGMKRLAKELNVPVICAAQLNREATKKAKPGLSDLRESGSLEQDADNVIFLYPDEAKEFTIVEIAKQRGGRTESHKMKLDGPNFRFEQVDGFQEYDYV